MRASSENEDEYRDFAEYYDHVVPYRDRPDIAFWIARAREAGGPVLELGCGTGRVLVPIAREGVAITGLDRSRAMLDRCRRRLADESLPRGAAPVRLVEGDMRDFNLGETFSLVTTPFRSFQHLLTPADQLACLAGARKHLRSGGKLVVDVFNPDVRRLGEETLPTAWVEEPSFTLPDGSTISRRGRLQGIDQFRQTLDVEFVYDQVTSEGPRPLSSHRLVVRYLFRFELEHLLARAGFEIVELLGDFEGSPFGEGSSQDLIAVARKA